MVGSRIVEGGLKSGTTQINVQVPLLNGKLTFESLDSYTCEVEIMIHSPVEL